MTSNNPANSISYGIVLNLPKIKTVLITFAILAIVGACGGGGGTVDLTNKNPNLEESGAKQLSEAPASGASAEAMFRGNASHTGSYEDPGVPSLNGLRWKFAISGRIRSSATIYEGYAYFGGQDFALHCVDIATGEEKWQFGTDSQIVSTPAVASGKVVFGSNDGHIYALSASDGKTAWKHLTGNPVNSSPTIVDGVVYIGSHDTKAYAIDLESGSVIWEFNTEGRIESSPAVGGGAVFFGSDDGNFFCCRCQDRNREVAL